MPQNLETIAAIATAPGKGGIGIVRLSGRNLATIAAALLGKMPSLRQATYTSFFDVDGSVIDRGIAIFFSGPNSYTGEDVLELHAHGGTAVLQLLLKSCLAAGARIALPGEFTQRAFLNDKLDLVQAEGVADLINATSEQAVRSATRSLDGEFSSAINKLVAAIIELRMQVEASIDFPEENIEVADIRRSEHMLAAIRAELEHILNLAQQGNILQEGAHVVLVGQPNVGKSSLLNVLAGEDVALVSDIAGTTRDSIHQYININGVPLHIVDTAGLRESHDTVELMGMERTKRAIQKADVVLVLMDIQNTGEDGHQKIIDMIPENTPKLYVVNKIDIFNQLARTETRDECCYIYLSAKTGAGIDMLRDKILQLMGWHGEAGVFMARERHLQALLQAKQFFERASAVIAKTEFFAEELTYAQRELSKITGEYTSNELLGEIFSRFCIGK